jgi:antitoxin VapB
MPLSIKDPRADELARSLVKYTGGTITDAVISALREKLEREERRNKARDELLLADIRRITDAAAKLPILDDRHPDDILYDEYGLPK